jgi:hypothetical protein
VRHLEEVDRGVTTHGLLGDGEKVGVFGKEMGLGEELVTRGFQGLSG